MRLRFHIRKEIKVIAALFAVGLLIAFEERRDDDLVIHDVAITLSNIEDNHYIDEDDIIDMIQLDKSNLSGARLTSVDIKTLENRIRANRYVKDAQLYCDLKGNMVIHADLHRPMARIVAENAPDRYVAEDGTLMPVATKYTSRVVLIGGEGARPLSMMQSLQDTEQGKQILRLLGAIHADEFWRAQIAEFDLDLHGEVMIYPQVGGQVIEFGDLTDINTRLHKLKVFYKEILPRMGWNKYKRVKLEYKDQIVAE